VIENSILIADSDDKSRQLLAKLLNIFGYTDVTEVKDGLTALEIIAKNSPSAAIIDANIPGINCFLMSEILHFVPRFRETSVILMKSSIDSAFMEKSILSGAYSFLEKPLTAEGIKHVLSGIKSPQLTSLKMSQTSKFLVDEIAKTTKAMLTLIFGQQGKVIKIEEMPSDLRQKTWEVAGVIRASGNVNLEIALGATKKIAKLLANWLGKKDLDTPATLGQAEGEFLDGILKRTLKNISHAYTLKSVPAQVGFNMPLPLSPKAEECFVIYLRVAMQSALLQKQLTLALVVTISSTKPAYKTK